MKTLSPWDIRLVAVAEHKDAAKILYALLEERAPEQSISHKEMPTWLEHLAFIGRSPYEAWYIVEFNFSPHRESGYRPEMFRPVGAIYLTPANEIGVAILEIHQGNGYGSRAVEILMKEYGERRYLANINPANEASIRMFEKLGFRHIQNTYERVT